MKKGPVIANERDRSTETTLTLVSMVLLMVLLISCLRYVRDDPYTHIATSVNFDFD